jgi:hypothetical protein
MPTEFDHVEMGRRSHPVDEDQFVLGSVERSHSRTPKKRELIGSLNIVSLPYLRDVFRRILR